MMTTQLVKNAQSASATSTWSTLFPEKQSTIEESTLFVKKLLAVGLSSITYLRALFPESAYDDRDLDGLKLKMLLDNSECYGAAKLVSWMKSAFQAIDKQYLRQLTFAMHLIADDPENAIESYTYKVAYSNNTAVISEFSTRVNSIEKKFDVKKSTQKMLRTVLLLTQSLNPLPSKVFLTMKIKYYDERTPVDYEPTGFMPAPPSQSKCPSDPVTIKVGDVSTLYHTVKLRVTVDKAIYCDDNAGIEEQIQTKNETQEKIQTDCSESEGLRQQDIEEPLPSSDPVITRSRTTNPSLVSLGAQAHPREDNLVEDSTREPHITVSQSSTLEDCVPSITPVNKANPVAHLAQTENVEEEVQVVPEESETESSHSQQSLGINSDQGNNTFVTPGITTSAEASAVPEGSGEPVNCPCGVSKDDGLMILCDICKTWQHAVCYKMLKREQVPEEHLCLKCSVTSGLPCSDTSLNDMNKEKVLETCLVRRVLEFLRNYQGRVTVSKVRHRLGVSVQQAQLVMNHLNSKSLLLSKGKGRGRLVNKSQVNVCWTEYFDSPPEDANWEGLQNSQHTPKQEQQVNSWDSDVTPDLNVPIHVTDSEMESTDSTALANSQMTQVIADSDSQKTTQRFQDTQQEATTCSLAYQQGLIVDSTQDVPIGTQRFITLGNGLDSSINDTSTLHMSQALATAGNTFASLGDTEAMHDNYASIPASAGPSSVPASSIENMNTGDGRCENTHMSKSATGNIFTATNAQVAFNDVKVNSEDPLVFGLKADEKQQSSQASDSQAQKKVLEVAPEETSETVGVCVDDSATRRALMTRSTRLSRDKSKQPLTMSLNDFEISSSQGSSTPDLGARKKKRRFRF